MNIGTGYASFLILALVLFLNVKLPKSFSFRSHHHSGTMSRARQPMWMTGDSLSDGDDHNLEEEETIIGVDEEGVVYRKGKRSSVPIMKRDNRDNLPYKTYIMMDDKARRAELIATLRLDAMTSCGDLIDLGDKGQFEVVRVSFVYVWRGSSFVVTGKRLYCKVAKKSWTNRVQNSLQ